MRTDQFLDINILRDKTVAHIARLRTQLDVMNIVIPILRTFDGKAINMKGSIGVRHHSTLVVNVTAGPLDLIGNCNKVCEKVCARRGFRHTDAVGHIQVNEYYAHEHFDGECKDFVLALIEAMNVGNHDRSDIQSDHFDVGWYTDINIGKWNKPYIVV